MVLTDSRSGSYDVNGDVTFFYNASSPAILVRIGRYFNVMFPYMVYLYGPY